MRLGLAGWALARSKLWVGSVVTGTFPWWRGGAGVGRPVTWLLFPRELSPLSQVPDSPGRPAPRPRIPHSCDGCPGLLWGRHLPGGGALCATEPTRLPEPPSPGLDLRASVRLCTVGFIRVLPGLCSWNPHPVYLLGSSPLATPPSRLWGGWFARTLPAGVSS